MPDPKVKVVTLVITSYLYLTLPSMAQSFDKHLAEHSITGAFHRMDLAYMKRDARAYLVYMHPNFSAFRIDGTQGIKGKKAYQEGLIKSFKHQAQIKAKTDILSISYDRTGAIVTVKSTVSADLLLQDGETVRLIRTNTSRDYWVPVNGRWLEFRSRTLTHSRSVNGKPVPYTD